MQCIGASRAGQRYSGLVGAGQCVRVSTGAEIPGGADTVVIQENVLREGERVRVLQPPPPGANVRAAGEECAADTLLLRRGTRLDARALALAGGGAALYYFKFRKPKADTTGHDDLDEYDFGEDEDADEEPAEIEIYSEDGQEDET